MSNKSLEHKRMLVAKCYELALDSVTEDFTFDIDLIDKIAMEYLDRINAASDIWDKEESNNE